MGEPTAETTTTSEEAKSTQANAEVPKAAPPPQDIPIPQTLEELAGINTTTPESPQDRLTHSAVKFAEYLTEKWPQVDNGRVIRVEVDDRGTKVELPELPEGIQTEPRLNYYLAGSLATMLLSRAKSVDICDETTGSSINVNKTIPMPDETAAALAQFARPMGDLDYVPTKEYKLDPNRLRKGGGGPSFDEVPPEASPVLRRGENQLKVMCDPVETYGTKKFARVAIDGREYYVARPDTIVGYKILHMMQSYHQKPEKFNQDFPRLVNAMKGLYTEDELVQTTYQTLGEFEASMQQSFESYTGEERTYERKLPGWTEGLLAQPDLASETRSFVEKVQAVDHTGILSSGTPSAPPNSEGK